MPGSNSRVIAFFGQTLLIPDRSCLKITAYIFTNSITSMKKLLLTLLAAAQLSGVSFAQEIKDPETKIKVKSDVVNVSPYKTRLAVDGPVAVVGVGLNGLGLYMIQKNKDAPSAEELAIIDADLEAAKQQVPKFDRFGAGNFDLD